MCRGDHDCIVVFDDEAKTDPPTTSAHPCEWMNFPANEKRRSDECFIRNGTSLTEVAGSSLLGPVSSLASLARLHLHAAFRTSDPTTRTPLPPSSRHSLSEGCPSIEQRCFACHFGSSFHGPMLRLHSPLPCRSPRRNFDKAVVEKKRHIAMCRNHTTRKVGFQADREPHPGAIKICPLQTH